MPLTDKRASCLNKSRISTFSSGSIFFIASRIIGKLVFQLVAISVIFSDFVEFNISNNDSINCLRFSSEIWLSQLFKVLFTYFDLEHCRKQIKILKDRYASMGAIIFELRIYKVEEIPDPDQIWLRTLNML